MFGCTRKRTERTLRGSMCARNTNVRRHPRRRAVVGRLTLVPGGRSARTDECASGASRERGSVSRTRVLRAVIAALAGDSGGD